MKMETPDGTAENIKKLLELFPECATEVDNGGATQGVNFKILKQLLSPDVIDGGEAYEFNWVGKKKAIVEANKPIRKTLRPCKEKSKNWDTTENIYIEGDNLEALKLLQESYLGKVKMIYIDPPYNTGSDFIYKDDFSKDKEEYQQEQGLFDEEENKLVQNPETKGRFHSDWCSMIFSRLVLARNLLKQNGVIFISIDDHEVSNLKKICDEVFGGNNYVTTLTIIVKTEGRRYGFFAKTHEYILVYAKNQEVLSLNALEVEGLHFGYNDKLGGFNLKELRNQNARAFNSKNRPNLRYPFFVNTRTENELLELDTEYHEGWSEVYPITINGNESVWRWGIEKAKKEIYNLAARKGSDGIIRVFQKYRKTVQEPKTVWMDTEIISNKGTKEIQSLMDGNVFDFPKPVNLVKRLIEIGTDEQDIILDFFSGSATTAHATMLQNMLKANGCKYIMIQLPEICKNNSVAFQLGYKTICDIGEERIRRAGEKIKADNPLTTQDLDVGFRVFKVDESNMKDVYYSAEEFTQESLSDMASNIKEDRSSLDLLFGCIVDWGVPLSKRYTSETIEGCTIHNYGDGDLLACFDENIPEAVFYAMARKQPHRVVFRDSCFQDSPAKINVTEVFKLLSPDTTIKVI